MRKHAFAMIGLLLAASAASAQALDQTPIAHDGIKPDAIYTTLPNNVACPTEDLLVKLIEHANAGERALASQMLAPSGGPCMVFPAGVQVRILHVDEGQSPDHAIIRFNLVDSPNADGEWSIDRLVKSAP